MSLPVWDRRGLKFDLEPCITRKLKLRKTQLELVYGFVCALGHAFVPLETLEYFELGYRLDGHLCVLLSRIIIFPLPKKTRRTRTMISKCLYAPFRLNFWEWLLSFLGFISLGGDFTSNDSVLLIHVFSVFWDWHSTLVALPLDLILIVWFFTGVFLRMVFKTWRGSGLPEMTWDHGFY